jgi:hypothetical protein
MDVFVGKENCFGFILIPKTPGEFHFFLLVICISCLIFSFFDADPVKCLY